VLELATDAAVYRVPFRVARSSLFEIRDRPVYRCAGTFSAPLELVRVVGDRGAEPMPERHAFGRLDVELKHRLQAVLQVGHDTPPGATAPRRALDIGEAVDLFTSLQEVCRRSSSDPGAGLMDEMLTDARAALQRSAPGAGLVSLVEERLRQALPRLATRFDAGPPTSHPSEMEVIYFRVPAPDDGPSPILSVGLPQGFRLEEWQFRLLRASTYVAALLRAASGDGPQGNERRRHQRVSGPFDGRWMSAIEMPVVIIDLSEGGCLISTLEEVEPGRQLTLEIDLPGEGATLVGAEAVGSRAGVGFAVKFVAPHDGSVANLRRFVLAEALAPLS
jgi:hypothetical protein